MDKKKLALIHIIKRDLNLSDEEYRAILEKAAGVTSAKDLTPDGLQKLMNYFVRSRHYRVTPGGLTVRQKMFIKSLLFDIGWSFEHFTNFLKKYYHTERIDRLSKKDASHLIESLKAIRERERS